MEGSVYVVGRVFCDIFALDVDSLVVRAPEFHYAFGFDPSYLVDGFHAFRLG